jgi:putative FmdB family regulatory protein
MYLSILFHMPSYDFICQDCSASFEVRLSMSAYANGEGRACPTCGSTKVERAFTSVNVIAGSHSGGSARSGGGCGHSGFT